MPQRVETVEGCTLEVQYFERRRMELHPELPGMPVLLGLLGREVLLLEGKAPTSPSAGNDARIVFSDGPTRNGSTTWNISTANLDGSNRSGTNCAAGNPCPRHKAVTIERGHPEQQRGASGHARRAQLQHQR
jgi:hypothetical protein